MIRGFKIIHEYLKVAPSLDVFFFLFTLTQPTSGSLTSRWLSFQAHVNQKVFLFFEESFHNFKPMYFKVFRIPGSIPFWETLEGELRFNVFWCKHFGAPRVDESSLKPEEKTVVYFLLESFGKNHLNLKNVVGVKAEEARRYLGSHLFLCYFISLFLYTYH